MYLLKSRSYLSREKGLDRDSIFSLWRISLKSGAGRDRQGPDLFARDDVSSLQGRQSQLGTRSLCQGGDLFSLWRLGSYKDQISSLGKRSRYLFFWDTRVGQGLDIFAGEEIFSSKGRQSQIGTSLLHQGGELFSLGLLGSDRDLDLIAREKTSCLQGGKIHKVTRYLGLSRNLFSLGPVESDRDSISSLGRRNLLSMTSRVIEGLDHFARQKISYLQVRQIQMGTRCIRQRVDFIIRGKMHGSDWYWIFSLLRIYLISRASRVRQGLDLFATEDISSLQGWQSHLGTRSLCQGGDLFSLW